MKEEMRMFQFFVSSVSLTLLQARLVVEKQREEKKKMGAAVDVEFYVASTKTNGRETNRRTKQLYCKERKTSKEPG